MVEELFDSLHQEPCWSADPLLLRLRDGVDYFTEEQADDYLKENRGTTTRDWLTKEQLALRIAKEVFNENGVPDSRLMSGMYKRVYNPNAGQRPSKGRRSNDE